MPASDDGLLGWSLNFSTLLTANYAAYGLAQSVATTYSSKYNTYKTALNAAQSSATRGKSTIYAKNQAKADLVGYTRLIASQILHTSTVTNQQRTDLGLIVRKKPSTNPAPTVAPGFKLKSVNGRTVTLRLTSSSPRNGKPSDVVGASVFSYVGAQPPADVDAWVFRGSTGKTEIDVPFDGSSQASTVWITAFWFNRRAESGPAALPPFSVNLPAGTALPQAGEMKIAA